jgi:hypothetical protein
MGPILVREVLGVDYKLGLISVMLKGQNRLMLRPALLTWYAWEVIPRTMVTVKAAFMCPLAIELQ